MFRSTICASILVTLATLAPLAAARGQAIEDRAGRQRLVFHNDSESYARGEGIVCKSDGEQPVRGRKFVVAIGATLECEAPQAAVDYRVFRNSGSGVIESEGRIEVE
jgi:hypothetical protein